MFGVYGLAFFILFILLINFLDTQGCLLDLVSLEREAHTGGDLTSTTWFLWDWS